MKQYFFTKFLAFLEKLTGKKIVYFPKARAGRTVTAVKSDFGFWYAGNVLDMSDIAYGVLYNGWVERDGSFLVKNILTRQLGKKNSLTFYDIGANTGYFGILAAFVGEPNKIKTYAFEPVEEFVKIERETVQLNRLENAVEIFNLALGADSGEITLHLAGSGSTVDKEFLGNRHTPSRKVKIKKLDDFISEQQLSAPDFIKIDVEGHELPVLKGAEQTIKTYHPIVWFESALTINVSDFKNKDFLATQNFLTVQGYELFFCGEQLKPVQAENVPDGVAMYLALHKDLHKDLLDNYEQLYAAN